MSCTNFFVFSFFSFLGLCSCSSTGNGQKNAYDLLGAKECDSFEKIGVSFRALLELYHPDNSATGDPEMYFKIFRNYEKIKTEKRRGKYNQIRGLCEREFWERSEETTRVVYVGIDLGTKYSGVGILRRDMKVELLRNEAGNRLTESVIGFPEDGSEPIVGGYAFSQISNKRRVVIDSKRLMGLNSNNEDLVMLKGKLPELIQTDIINGRVIYSLPNSLDDARDIVTPEYAGSLILKKFKNMVNRDVGKDVVIKAVISVPSNFEPSQVEATKHAAWLAGLEVIKFIKEPNAAALAYTYEGIFKKVYDEKTYLVVDFGGGTLDLSLVTYNGTDFKVLDNGGDPFLGGEDFTHRLYGKILEKYEESGKADGTLSKITNWMTGSGDDYDDYVRLEILEKAETAKRGFESLDRHMITIRGRKGLFVLTYFIEEFNVLCKDLFQRFELAVDQFVKQYQEKGYSPDEVVLIGGSMRLRQAEVIIEKIFKPRKIHCDVNPDEAVALGAALEAGSFMSFMEENEQGRNVHVPQVTDLVSKSLGVGVVGYKRIKDLDERRAFKEVYWRFKGKEPPVGGEDKVVWDKYADLVSDAYDVIIERGKSIPATKVRKYQTTIPNQNAVTLDILQGDGMFVYEKGISKLAQFKIKNLKQARGKKKVDLKVTFVADEDGLFVTAETEGQGSSLSRNLEIEIESDSRLEELLNVGRKNRKYSSKVPNQVYNGEL